MCRGLVVSPCRKGTARAPPPGRRGPSSARSRRPGSAPARRCRRCRLGSRGRCGRPRSSRSALHGPGGGPGGSRASSPRCVSRPPSQIRRAGTGTAQFPAPGACRGGRGGPARRRLEAVADGREVEGDERGPGEHLGVLFVHLVRMDAIQERERAARMAVDARWPSYSTRGAKLRDRRSSSAPTSPVWKSNFKASTRRQLICGPNFSISAARSARAASS